MLTVSHPFIIKKKAEAKVEVQSAGFAALWLLVAWALEWRRS